MVDRKTSTKKKIYLALGAIVLIFVIAFVVRYFSLFWGVVVDRKIDVVKAKNGNVNILLLGIGGGRHDGPNLTDTIILASVNPSKNTVNLVSIPRDLYVQSIKSKVNRAYSDGEEEEGKGMLLARAAIDSITGVRADYVVVVDFSGFIKLVDLLGGIDVNVQNTLDDYAYPDEGKENELCGVTEDGIASFSAQIATGSATDADIFPCRFIHLHVDKGLQHMDGELALKFARSRHALGGEGSDFARSKRQQLVIDAVRNKVLSLGTLANPVKVIGMINILQGNIHTDIPENKLDDFIKLAQKMKDAKIGSAIIDEGNPGENRLGLLINPPLVDYGGQWVLVPRSGNFLEIREYVACVFSGAVCEVTETGIKKSVTPTSSPKPTSSN